MGIYTHTHIHAYIHTYVSTYLHIHTHTHMHTCRHMSVYIQVHIHTRTHTYTIVSVVSGDISHTAWTKILDSEKYVAGNTADGWNYFKKEDIIWLKWNNKTVYFRRSWDRAPLMYSFKYTNKMQRYTIFFIALNALHVSGGFSVHHQER